MYNTKQGQMVYDFLLQYVGTPISPQQIHEHLVQMGQKVGLATIYRQLDKLSKEGKVRKYLPTQGITALYELCEPSSASISFKCDCCGKVEHLQCENFSHTKTHMLEDHGIYINTQKTVFYGECNACHTALQKRSKL